MATKTKWENADSLIDLSPVVSETGNIEFTLDGDVVTASAHKVAAGKMTEAQTFAATRSGVITVDERDQMVEGGIELERVLDIVRTFNQTRREDAINSVNAAYRDAREGKAEKKVDSAIDTLVTKSGKTRVEVLAALGLEDN